MVSKKTLKAYCQLKFVSRFGMNLNSASNHIPSWYKKIPPTFNGEPFQLIKGTPNTTVKACTPFLDAMTAGYTFYLPADVYVSWLDGVPRLNWKGEREFVTLHNFEQTDNLPIPVGHNKQVFKWQNEYVIETPKGYSLWCTHPVNRFDLPFTVISGFVDTDKYTMSIHFPFFIQEGWTGVIEKGTPVAQVIPVKRDDWILEETPTLEFEELRTRVETYRTRIFRAYKHFFWQKKSYR
jgi:hypothetical protein